MPRSRRDAVWTSKLMVDGIWRGDIVPTPGALAKMSGDADAFRARGALSSEPHRYHLYVSYACPFAHRVILGRLLRRLETRVGLSVLHPRWNTQHGWSFGVGPMSTPDHANGLAHLHQLYALAKPDYTGRVTVPVLWDGLERRIVSNDSAEILSLLGGLEPHGSCLAPLDLYPPPLRQEMDELRERDLGVIATGVYAIGGATSQAAYEASVRRVFAALDRLDRRLSDGRAFLHGELLTASDVLLFTPLARFDAVYHTIFRASLRRVADYEWLSAWMSRVLGIPGIAETVRLDEILVHYDDGWAPRCGRIEPLAATPRAKVALQAVRRNGVRPGHPERREGAPGLRKLEFQ